MKKFVSILILVCFIVTGQIGTCPVYAQDFVLPAPGVMVRLSPEFDPPILKGIKVHPDDPFRFDFILDKGDGDGDNIQLKEESSKLIKYFLASLTIPEKDLWVNLSPYEKDRIIPQSFGLTEMGRDLLAQDYLLKQITASLIFPEDEFGRKFWNRVYEEAAKKFGTTNIPVNTFNKVWIVPEKAVVYENANAGTAYIVESRLKVMLDQDYLSLTKHLSPGASTDSVNALGSQIVREIVIPQLTKEINENSNFAQLRQVYNSLILATWYKRKIKDSLLNQVYADRNKVRGVDYSSKQYDINGIYQEYLRAFKKGVYNYIKEEEDPVTRQVVPRKYFSGGITDLAMRVYIHEVTQDKLLGVMKGKTLSDVTVAFDPEVPGKRAGFDLAMNTQAALAGQPVDQEDLPREYFHSIEDVMGTAIARYRENKPTDDSDFMFDMLDRVAGPYFPVTRKKFSARSKASINQNDPNRELKVIVKNLGSTLASTSFFPRQRHFGFIISAFIGEQAFDDYTNIFIPRDMGPGYTIQRVINELIPSPTNEGPGIYYLSRAKLGGYYDKVVETISDEKLLGVIASVYMQRLTALKKKEDYDPEYFQAIQAELKRDLGRQVGLMIRKGVTDINALCDGLLDETVIRNILLKIEKERGDDINPQGPLPEYVQEVQDVFMSLRTQSPGIKREVSRAYAIKQKTPFLERITAKIREQMEADPQFRDTVDAIAGDFENLDYASRSKVRFVDSGAGTFLLFLQAMFKIKYPSIETKSLALGIYNKDVMEVLDAQQWNEGIRKLVHEKDVLRKYLEYPLKAMESADKFILHPIVYDPSTGKIKRTEDKVHLTADWVLANMGLSAIDYVQALHAVVANKEADDLVGAAKHIRTTLGIDTHVDEETGQIFIAEGDALAKNPLDDEPPDDTGNGNTGEDLDTLGFPEPKGDLPGWRNRLQNRWIEAVAFALGLFLPYTLSDLQAPKASTKDKVAASQAPKINLVSTNQTSTNLIGPYLADYQVKPGDTLSDLAYSIFGDGTSNKFMELYRLNPSKDPPDLLRADRTIKLPGHLVEYVVLPGDDFTNIAVKFYGSASSSHLYRIKHFNRVWEVKSGMKLTIPMSPEENAHWEQQQKGPSKSSDSAMSSERPSTKKKVLLSILTSVLAFLAVSYQYGKHLINQNYQGAKTAANINKVTGQINLDLVSEGLINKLCDPSDNKDFPRQVLSSLPEGLRQKIVQAFFELPANFFSKDGNHKLVFSQLKANHWEESLQLISFLESGLLKGPDVNNKHDVKELWEVFSGEQYDPVKIFLDSLNYKGVFERGSRGLSNPKNFYLQITDLIEANIPWEAKLEYIHAVGSIKYWDYMTPPSLRNMWDALKGLNGHSWQDEAHHQRAILFVANHYKVEGSRMLREKLVEYHGGFNKVLADLKDKVFFEKLMLEEANVGGINLQVSFIKGSDHIKSYFRNSTYQEIHQFSTNFQKLSVERRKEFDGIFTFVNFTEAPLSADLPLRYLKEPVNQIYPDLLDGWANFKQGVVEIRNEEDYQKFVGIRDIFIAAGLEGDFSKKVVSVSFNGSMDLKQLVNIMKYYNARHFNSKIDATIIESLKLHYDQIGLAKVSGQEDFIRALYEWDFLEQWYLLDPVQYPQYQAYEGSLLALNLDWDGYVAKLPENDLGVFYDSTEILARSNPVKADHLFTVYLESHYPQFQDSQKIKDIAAVDAVRQRINKISHLLGEEFVIGIADGFMSKHPVTAENIGELLDVAKAWRDPENDIADENDQELYKTAGSFMANNIYAFLQHHHIKNKDAVLEQLKALGVIFKDDDPREYWTLYKKFSVALAQGNIGYITQKAETLIPQRSNVGVTIEASKTNQMSQAFQANEVKDSKGKKIGDFFVIDPQKGAKADLSFDPGLEHGGVTEQRFLERNPNQKLALDFTLAFVNDHQYPIDIAAEKGVIMNRQVSMDKYHGLLIVYKNRTMKIFDKRHLQVNDLFVNPTDNKYPNKELDFTQLKDNKLLFDIIKNEGLSIASSMLLIDEGKPVFIEDHPDSRRLLLQFTDGRKGLLNLPYVSTADATRIAAGIKLENGAIVKYALDCDTGNNDNFNVYPENGAVVHMGDSRHPNSSNRVFFSQGSSDKNKAMITALKRNTGGIDLSTVNANFQTQDNGNEIKFHMDRAVLDQLKNAPGFVPVIINIQPMTNLRRFLGLNEKESASVAA